MAIDLSVLDLVPVPSGTAASAAVRQSIDLARVAKASGYRHRPSHVAAATPGRIAADSLDAASPRLSLQCHRGQAIADNRAKHIIGSPETVARQLSALAERTRADELMIVSNIHDASARLRSDELVAEAMTAPAKRAAAKARG